jgi:colanic acid/amylovoran biosynthesis glycosyltransferase
MPKEVRRRPLRVLHFCEAFSHLSETFIYDLVWELESQGLDNEIVTLFRFNTEERFFPKVITVPAVSRWHHRRIFQRALSALGVVGSFQERWPVIRSRLAVITRTIAPDVIHAQFGPAGVLIAPVARALGVPLIVTFHGYDYSVLPRNERWANLYRTELVESPAAFIGVSNHVCRKLREQGFPCERLHVVNNGIRIEAFQFSDPTKRWDGRSVKCLYVGRLVEKKSPILLIRAFREALKSMPPGITLSLDIIGDGPLKPALLEEIAQLGMDSSVAVLGALPHEVVSKKMSEAHLYIQHSVTASTGDQEGQPVSITEAAACGLPVIATRHNGIPDIVLDGITGYLVDEGDYRAMGARIADLACNPPLWSQMGMRARHHIEKNMNLALQAERLAILYRNYADAQR